MNRLQRLIRDYLDSHPGETYSSIARRGGIHKSTVQNTATTESRRQTSHPATLEGLARGMGIPLQEVKAAAADAAGYSSTASSRDELLVELEEYAAPLSEERKRELIALARYMMQQTREAESGDEQRGDG